MDIPLNDTIRGQPADTVDVDALAASLLPEWVETPNDQAAWIATFIEAYDETQDEEKATLAASGRVNKRHILGIKSVKSAEGGAIVSGWGLLFGDRNDLDLQETYFDDETQLLLDMYQTAPLFMEHGEDPAYGIQPIGQRSKTMLYPRGVWVEHTLNSAHPLYKRTLRELENGELAYSSDSLGHLVEKGYNERDGRLGFWPLAGWSLVHDPAEPALGAVTLKQFAGALKSAAREARIQGHAQQASGTPVSKSTTDPIVSGAPRTMNPNEIFAALCSALNLPPDSTPEVLEMAVQEAINSFETSPEAAMSAHAAMGGDVNKEPDPADLSEKMNNLYKMATAQKDDALTPEPIPAAMNSQRNFDGLKNVADLASAKSAANRGSAMPYQVNGNKSTARDYSTRGAPAFNKGIKEPGIYEMFRDIHSIKNGMRPTYIGGAKAMSYATGPAGGYVLTQEVSDQILDPLRAEAVVLKLGARQEDLDGVQVKMVPAMQTAPDAYWVGEGQTVTDSQPTYRMISLVPKPLANLVLRPFNFFQNMTPNAESQLRKEIQRSMALKIDYAALLGTGGAAASPNTGSSPVGLLNNSGVTNTLLATNGRQPTISDLIGMQKRLDDANVPEGGNRGFAFHPSVRHVFTGMSDSTGQPILRESWGSGEGREILGEPFASTTQIPKNVTAGSNSNTSYIFYGDWRYMIVGMTTTVELVLDQTYAASLQQGLLAYIYADIQLDYGAAFQTLSGVTYS